MKVGSAQMVVNFIMNFSEEKRDFILVLYPVARLFFFSQLSDPFTCFVQKRFILKI